MNGSLRCTFEAAAHTAGLRGAGDGDLGRRRRCSKIAELPPDVVLMDIHIDGDIDGIETAATHSARAADSGHLSDGVFRGGDAGARAASRVLTVI